MRTIYIHIGLGKTGTSFLQSAFAYNAHTYRSLGLIYPDLQKDLSAAAGGHITSGNGLPIAANAIPELAKSIAPIAPTDLLDVLDVDFDYLISSEWLSSCSLNYLESVITVLSQKFHVQVIVFVRDPAEHIVSIYHEALKHSKYSLPVDAYIDELIEGLKHPLRLILNLKHSARVINYDYAKLELVGRFDHILFGRNVSATPPALTVNPSPNFHQTLILQLANCLGLSDVRSARGYISKSGTGSSPKYRLPLQLAEKVYRDLRPEIDEINRLLPKEEPITLKAPLSDTASLDPFQTQDIEFLSERIKAKITSERRADFAFIATCAEKASSLDSSQLPEGFSVTSYLLHNPDLVAARVNPIKHYLTYGAKEGRRYR